jgi:hypothetical protein
MKHVEGKKNPADGPSRRLYYAISQDYIPARLLATLAATMISKSNCNLLSKIKTPQEVNFLATKIWPTMINVSASEESQSRSIDGGLTYERMTLVPTTLHSGVTSQFLGNPKSAHFGVLKSAELESRSSHWPAMQSVIS